jgi:glyoxylase-like metal-dependent hydrolase (beta-lactamase superfamily II)
LPEDRARDIVIPIPMWIIDHPKGIVVFDTGNNVALNTGGCEAHWGAGSCNFLKPSQKRADVIDMQLKKLGYQMSDVVAVITSHSHLDHMGNVEMFPNALHILQKRELYQAWWPEKFQRSSGAHIMADYDDARDFNYFALDGDLDVFGDGSITVLDAPGHTLGNSSLKLKFANGDTFVIAQDALWMRENLEGYPAGLNYSVKAYFETADRLKYMSDLENAELFFGHDEQQWKEKGNRWYK